ITRPSSHPHARNRTRRPGGGSPRSNRLETTTQRPTRHHSYTTSPDGTCACRALVSIKPTLDLTNQFRVKPDGSSLHQAGPDGLIFGGVYPGTDVLNEVPFVVVSLGSPRVSYICDGGALRLCLCGCSQDDVNG